MGSWEEAVLWLRQQTDQADLVRAAFFDDPVSTAACRYHASTEWTAMQSLLSRPPGVALEIGAGRGIASYALARDGWTVTALEPDPSAVVGGGAIRSLVAETGVPISLVADWGESLPFEMGQFDIVLCRQVLHHARDLRAFCREIQRVLKPGGTLYATREHVLSKASDLDAFLASHPLHHRYGGEHAYVLRDYVEALRAAGLVVTKVMNPLESDINTYPDTRQDLRCQIARRLRVPAAWIPLAALTFMGARLKTPGRLYSFVARKHRHD